jgi:sugar phosphate isomerase/epimerase
MLQLMEGVGHPAVRLLLDHGNFFRHKRQYDLDALPLLSPYVAHVHVKDVAKTWFGGAHHCVIGRGILDFPAHFRGLLEFGYRGLFSVETHMHARSPAKKWQNSVACFRGLTSILNAIQ